MGYHNARLPMGAMQRPMSGTPVDGSFAPQPSGPLGGGMPAQLPTDLPLQAGPGGMAGMPAPLWGIGGDAMGGGGMAPPQAPQASLPGGLPMGGGFPATGGGDPMAVGPGIGPSPSPMPSRPQPQTYPAQPPATRPAVRPPTAMNKPGMAAPGQMKPPAFAGASPMPMQRVSGGPLQAPPAYRKPASRGNAVKRQQAQNSAKAKGLVSAASSYKRS